jgi:hypothetical protein
LPVDKKKDLNLNNHSLPSSEGPLKLEPQLHLQVVHELTLTSSTGLTLQELEVQPHVVTRIRIDAW